MEWRWVWSNQPSFQLNFLFSLSQSIQCFFACLFNSTGSFTNGNINIPALKSVASKTLTSTKQTKWIETVNEAIDFCSEKTVEFRESLAKSLKGTSIDNQKVCSPIPQFMGSCIYFRQIAKCPFKVKQTPQCNDLQSFYQRCPIPALFWKIWIFN